MENDKSCDKSSTEQADTRRVSARKPYIAPEAKHLGSVRQLTLGATGRRSDGAGGQRASSRDFKEDIRYLGTDDRSKLAQHVLNIKLATYKYRPELGERPGQQLGFMIEDSATAPFVDTNARHVDLYAFASGLCAVVQEQQARIAKLEADLRALTGERPHDA